MPKEKTQKKEEVETSSEESTEKTQPAQTAEEDTSQKTESEEKSLEDRLAETEERLTKSEKKAADFEKAFRKEKEKRQGLETSEESQEDEVPEWYRKEQEKQRKDTVQNAFDDFVKGTPELHEENDLNNEKYNQFKSVVEKRRPFMDGSNPEEVKKSMEFIYNQEFGETHQTQSSESAEVEDSGIGDTSPTLKSQEQKPSALTRPLTQSEKQAAQWFPRGNTPEEKEKLYREKLAKRETIRSGEVSK